MRNKVLVSLLILVLAVVGTVLSFHCFCDPARHLNSGGCSMDWLRREYHLTEEQYKAIDALHVDYSKECAEHCRLISEARAEQLALRAKSPLNTAALAANERKIEQLNTLCGHCMTMQFEKVAALMSPEQGTRYLKDMRALTAKQKTEGEENAAPAQANHEGHGH